MGSSDGSRICEFVDETTGRRCLKRLAYAGRGRPRKWCKDHKPVVRAAQNAVHQRAYHVRKLHPTVGTLNREQRRAEKQWKELYGVRKRDRGATEVRRRDRS
jgi:hypothetical protein